MTINYNRRFTYNGIKYYIQTIGKKQYSISRIEEDGRFTQLYNNLRWDMPIFDNIKDAKRYVRDWDFTLEAM